MQKETLQILIWQSSLCYVLIQTFQIAFNMIRKSEYETRLETSSSWESGQVLVSLT